MLLPAHALFRPLSECVALAQELHLFCLIDNNKKKTKKLLQSLGCLNTGNLRTFVALLYFYVQLYQTDFPSRYDTTALTLIIFIMTMRTPK